MEKWLLYTYTLHNEYNACPIELILVYFTQKQKKICSKHIMQVYNDVGSYHAGKWYMSILCFS